MYSWGNKREEACMAGRRALLSLKAAQRELNKASDLGLWDMFGGGFFVSMAKRSRMDDANRYLEQAQNDIEDFKKACEGAVNVGVADLKTDDFLSFADVWMDNFFVDYLIQNRINETKKQVNLAIEKVSIILRQLGD